MILGRRFAINRNNLTSFITIKYKNSENLENETSLQIRIAFQK